MEKSGAIHPDAIRLNGERVTYEGGARLADAHEARRMMILRTPADKFLDQQHLNDCVEEVATWAPDVLRQKMLRELGREAAQRHLLRPDELEALAAQWHKAIGPR